jgi:Leucine-rich repeat (LRR) protein
MASRLSLHTSFASRLSLHTSRVEMASRLSLQTSQVDTKGCLCITNENIDNIFTQDPKTIISLSLRGVENVFVMKNAISLIPEMTSLKVLDLSYNTYNHSGIFPEGIKHLKCLQELSMTGCDIKIVPDWIGDLQTLTILDLSENPIEYLSPWIGTLCNLKHLNISNNDLSNAKYNPDVNKGFTKIPDSFGNLKSIESLQMDNGCVTELPESIGDLRTLKHLYIEDNRLLSLPKSIGNLQRLKTLNTGSNLLTTLPKEIANLENLESFDISYNSIPLTDNFKEYFKYTAKYDRLKSGEYDCNPGDPQYTEMENILNDSNKWSGITLSELIKELVN